MQCYCGSNLKYQQCCEPFITGQQHAQTPEQLMRSRFSAYCAQQVDYIFQTYHSSQQDHNSKQDIASFAASSHFVKLEIISSSGQTELPRTKPTPDSELQLASAGYVEFVVSYLQGGKLHQFSEVSRFLPLVTSVISPLESSSTKGISADPLPINSANRSTAEPCWQWRYIDGVLSNRPSKSIGRNDACPCGSGKKFKQCLVHHSAH